MVIADSHPSSMRARNTSCRQYSAKLPKNDTKNSIFIQHLALKIQHSVCVRDCSGNPAKAGALGHRERQSDREEATVRDHEPHSLPTAELQRKARRRAQRAGTPKSK